MSTAETESVINVSVVTTEQQAWRPAPGRAAFLRAVAFVLPVAVGVALVAAVSPFMVSPSGAASWALWLLQALPVALAGAWIVDRFTRRLLPVAALYDLSLVFPGRPPSRLRTARRAVNPRWPSRRIGEVREHGLGDDPSTAASTAIELVLALGRHDRLARDHHERVRFYADRIAVQLGIPEHDRQKLAWGVILHDIGKVAIPDEVLNRVGRPTDDEWVVLASHPERGAELLEPLASWLGEWVRAASEHHERWDGAGYPQGLAGEEISLAGRITAVADAFDVITTKMSYERGLANEAARAEMRRCAGSQFDPAVVEALLEASVR